MFEELKGKPVSYALHCKILGEAKLLCYSQGKLGKLGDMLTSPTHITITQEAVSSLGFSGKVTARFPSVAATTTLTKWAKSPA